MMTKARGICERAMALDPRNFYHSPANLAELPESSSLRRYPEAIAVVDRASIHHAETMPETQAGSQRCSLVELNWHADTRPLAPDDR